MPKISIVTVTLNSSEFITECMDSVAQQTFADFEHIIQDGASKDDTVQIINSFLDARVNLVSNPDSGLYNALNKGFRRTRADIVGILHSDDLFYDNKVLSQVYTAFQDPTVDAVYGNLIYVDRNCISKVKRVWIAGNLSRIKVKFGWMPPHPTLFVRRKLLDKYGVFDESLHISADYDIFLRYFLSGNVKFCYLPIFMTKMRAGGVSNRSFSSFSRRTYEDFTVIKRNGLGGFLTLLSKWFIKVPQFFLKV
jgi:glycosyltransferase involved in cell wall biosynthesis